MFFQTWCLTALFVVASVVAVVRFGKVTDFAVAAVADLNIGFVYDPTGVELPCLNVVADSDRSAVGDQGGVESLDSISIIIVGYAVVAISVVYWGVGGTNANLSVPTAVAFG